MTTKRALDWIFNIVYIIVAIANFTVAFAADATVGQRVLSGILGLAFGAMAVFTIRNDLKLGQ